MLRNWTIGKRKIICNKLIAEISAVYLFSILVACHSQNPVIINVPMNGSSTTTNTDMKQENISSTSQIGAKQQLVRPTNSAQSKSVNLVKYWNAKKIDVVYRADKQKGDIAGKIWCDKNKTKEECTPQIVVYHVTNLSERIPPADDHPVWNYVASLDIPSDNSIENYGYQLFDINGNLK